LQSLDRGCAFSDDLPERNGRIKRRARHSNRSWRTLPALGLAPQSDNCRRRNEPKFCFSHCKRTSTACGTAVTTCRTRSSILRNAPLTWGYLEPCSRTPSRSCIPCCRSSDSSCRSFCNRLACLPQKRPCTPLRPKWNTGFSCNSSWAEFRSRARRTPVESES